MTTLYLEARDINFCYFDTPVIPDWSGRLLSFDVVHLKGANGSGKSTLLKILAGILKPQDGRLEVFASLGFVGHQLGLHPLLTVNENLNYALGAQSLADGSSQLSAAKLDVHQHRQIAYLSLGQQHKVAMLRLMAEQADIWLLDEPFANLDHDSEAWLWQQIDTHRQKGGAVVFTAHQRSFKEHGATEWVMP